MRIKLKRGKSYGLIGSPVTQSLSPRIHEKLLSLRNITATYTLYETGRDGLSELFKNTLCGLDGFNVTIPHKVNIIEYLDSLSPRAELFGAVNTVAFDSGKAIGYNTDCIGFLRSLDGAGIELGGKVLILGAGGAARTFAFESAIAGADVTIAVRPSGLERANVLKNEITEKLSVKTELTTIDCVSGEYDLIINATPVGMLPDTSASPLEREKIIKSKAVFDAVYNPYETLLLKYACEGGLKCLNGLPMLVWQAAAAEEIWNGVRYKKDEIDLIIKELEKR